MKELQQIDTIGEGDAEYKQVVGVLLFLLNEREVTNEVWFGLVCDRQTHVSLVHNSVTVTGQVPLKVCAATLKLLLTLADRRARSINEKYYMKIILIDGVIIFEYFTSFIRSRVCFVDWIVE